MMEDRWVRRWEFEGEHTCVQCIRSNQVQCEEGGCWQAGQSNCRYIVGALFHNYFDILTTAHILDGICKFNLEPAMKIARYVSKFTSGKAGEGRQLGKRSS